MGSGSSSNVKPLDIKASPPQPKAKTSADSDDRVQQLGRTATEAPAESTPTRIDVLERPSSNTKRPKSSGSTGKASVVESVSDEQDELTAIKAKLKEVKAKKKELENQQGQLEKQIGELESDNLDLLERVQVLEEQLEKEHAAKLARATTPCVNTVAAKDQYITKLEKETKAVQEEITKLKLKYKKKIRQMNSQLSEAKHESSLNVFEMKDELQKLRQENSKLNKRIKMTSIPEEPDSLLPEPQTHDTGAADRMGLILDLSGQVSAQENQILELEQKIREKDRTIDQLIGNKPREGSSKGKINGSGKVKSTWDIGQIAKEVENDDWSVDGQNITNFNNEKTENIELPPPGTRDIALSEMRAIARDMKELQKKKGAKKKNQLRGRMKASPGLESTNISTSTPNSRESSGTSRDSGIVPGDSKYEHNTKWMSSRSKKTDFDLYPHGSEAFDGERDEGLELQSFRGTPSLPRTVRTASPESVDSRWSDDEHEADGEKADVKSTISVSSIRRISAPKKKKKHVLSDQDMIVDSLLKDFDEPMANMHRNRHSTDTFQALSQAIPASGQ